MTTNFRAQYQWVRERCPALLKELATDCEIEAAYAAAHPPEVTANDVLREAAVRRHGPQCGGNRYELPYHENVHGWFQLAQDVAQSVADARNAERRAKALGGEPVEDDGWIGLAADMVCDRHCYYDIKCDLVEKLIREAYAARVKP